MRRTIPDRPDDPNSGVDAWAFIVLGERYGPTPQSSHLEFLGWHAQSVLYDAATSHQIGTTRLGSELAEREGLFWAMLWRLGQNSRIPTCFRPDNLTTAGQAQGAFGAQIQDDSFRCLRGVHQALETFLPEDHLQFAHARGHAGDPWNEIVDQIAKQEAKKSFIMTRQHVDMREWLVDLPHLWTYLAEDAGLPPLTIHGHEPYPPDLPRMSSYEALTEVRQQDVSMKLSLGSGNVASMYTGPEGHAGKLSYLRQQMIQHGLNIVGLQETRTPPGLSQTDKILRLSGGAQGKHYGLELWVNLDQPIAHIGTKPMKYRRQHFIVTYADPQLLVVRAQHEIFDCWYIVGHAPHSGRSTEDRMAWWTHLHDILQLHTNDAPSFFMLDANATTGPCDQIHVGPNDDQDNVNTGFLRHFLHDHDLCLPATFTVHTGTNDTWISPDGQYGKRIDYVAVPLQFLSRCTHSCVVDSFDLGQTHDHSLVAIDLSWMTCQTLPCRRRNNPKRTMPTTQQIRDIPPERVSNHVLPQWHCDIGTQVALFNEHVQTTFKTSHSQDEQPWKKPFIDENIWNTRSLKLQAKRSLGQTRRQLKGELLRQCFGAAWLSMHASAQPSTADDEAPSIERTQALRCSALRQAAQLWRHARSLRHDLKQAKAKAITDCLEGLPGTSSASTILRALKPHIGPTNLKKIKRAALPMARNTDGAICSDPTAALNRWIEHFMTMEGGERVDAATQQALWIQTLQELRLSQVDLRWDQAPSLLDLEQACRQVALDKATGPDDAPSSFVHIHACRVAKLLYPQLLKLLIHGQEALIHKGGRLAIAYKGKGPFDACEAYRSLLASSHPSKTLHKTLRTSCTSIFDAYFHRQQLGGRKHAPVTLAARLTRAYLRSNQRLKRSVAILFLDLKEAFYRVVRGVVLQAPHDDEMLARLAQRLELPPDALHELHHLVAQGDSLTAAGMPPHIRTAVRALHEDTHFHLPGQPDACRTRIGTRPGDSWADVIFSFAWARLLHGLQADLQERGILDSFQEHDDWSPFHPHDGQREARAVFLGPTWMDDLSLGVSGETGQEAESRIGHAASLLLEKCANFGMTPNLAKGKTEILVSFRGTGSRKLRLRYFGGSASGSMPVVSQYGTASISVVGEYVHLGNLIHHSGHSGREMHRRLGIAHQAYATHRKHIYANPQLQLTRRRELFDTLITTKLLYGSETWTPCTWKEKEHMHAGIMKLYKRLCRVPHDAALRDEEVLSFGGLPSPSELLRRQRLRYLTTLFRCADVVPWGLLAQDDDWCTLLCYDIEWMYEQLKNASNLANPTVDFAPWRTILVHYPGYWRRLVRRSCEHARMQREREEQVRRLHCTVIDELRAHGLPCAPPPRPERAPMAFYGCLTCRLRRKSLGGEGAHMFTVHGQRAFHRRYCEGTQCAACLKEFHTVGRLLHHLRSSKTCRCTLASRGFWNVDEHGEGSAAHTQQERVHNGLRLVQQAEGPQLPPTQREEPDRIHQECYDAIAQYLLTHSAPAFEPACRALPALHPISWSLFRSTLQSVWSSMSPQDWDLAAETEIAMKPVVDRLLAADTWDTFQQTTLSTKDSHNHLDLYDLEGWMLKIAATPDLLSDSLTGVERPRFRERVVLHAFSGRRRRGDLQEFMDRVALQHPSITLLVVSLDIVVDEQYGDVRNEQMKQMWLRAIRSGHIIAMLAGPPCNTWSAARAHAVSSSSGRPAPRVVRPSDEAWGACSLSLRELADACVGNDLLIFTLVAFLLLFFNQGLSVVEHPDEPQDLNAVSIWRLPIMQVLLCLPGVELHHILQGLFGAESPKPTGFLTLNLPGFRHTLYKGRLTTQPPMHSSIGVTASGEFKTAKLKEYPPALCSAISQSFLDAILEESIPQDCSSLPSDFHEICKKMTCSAFGDYMGPDFAGK